MDYHAKNVVAMQRLRTELKSKVEVVQFPVPVLRDLKKMATQVNRDQSNKSPMARKVHASFTKLQTQLGPWDHVSQSAYHQFLKA